MTLALRNYQPCRSHARPLSIKTYRSFNLPLVHWPEQARKGLRLHREAGKLNNPSCIKWLGMHSSQTPSNYLFVHFLQRSQDDSGVILRHRAGELASIRNTKRAERPSSALPECYCALSSEISQRQRGGISAPRLRGLGISCTALRYMQPYCLIWSTSSD